MAMVARSKGYVYMRQALTCPPSFSRYNASAPNASSRVLNNVPGLQISGTVSSVRHYAEAPAVKPEEQDPLKRIFFNMMKKYKTFVSELTKQKITLDPDDPKAVSDYKSFVDSIRKKVGVPSQAQKLKMLIQREAASAPDVKSFYKSLPEIKSRFGITEPYDGDKLMVEAVEKVEKKIGRALVKGDKEGMALLHKEFEAIYKALGVDPSKVKEVEAEVDFTFAKAELIQMKDEVVDTIETHKKRFGLEEIKVDLRTLDHRNYL
ncbi:hypothetical protein GOP47_0002127 [Adiantum capillus-veneris]|uniref:Uncharacterized protein n=1 Tax=Adiantum capillus-veneris TaxID=13818 RepID=A0A9D4VAA7_ADICA|nr:hypothetical protein GOP47_0002127 [Adiantum capillus-veneris]